MRLIATAIIACPLLLFGTLTTATGQPVSSIASFQLAADSDPPSERETYTQKAHDDMQAWQQKLRDFGERAKAKGDEAGNAAGQGLNAAWIKAQVTSSELQTVGAENWDKAKSEFEKATQDLADAWDRAANGEAK